MTKTYITRIMGLKEFLRYEKGLTVIPLTDMWSYSKDCGLEKGGALFFVPGDAREMSCVDLCNMAVLASGSQGQKRILATFEVDADSVKYGNAKINETIGPCTSSRDVSEAYLPMYNKDTAKLIFVDRNFEDTLRYANDIVLDYSSNEEDYENSVSWTERGTPEGNINYPYKNRVTHLERAENKRCLQGAGYDPTFEKIIENRNFSKYMIEATVDSLCTDVEWHNRRFNATPLSWLYYPDVYISSFGGRDYDDLFKHIKSFADNEQIRNEMALQSVIRSEYLADAEKEYYHAYMTPRLKESESLAEECNFLYKHKTDALDDEWYWESGRTDKTKFFSLLPKVLDTILGENWETEYYEHGKEYRQSHEMYNFLETYMWKSEINQFDDNRLVEIASDIKVALDAGMSYDEIEEMLEDIDSDCDIDSINRILSCDINRVVQNRESINNIGAEDIECGPDFKYVMAYPGDDVSDDLDGH